MDRKAQLEYINEIKHQWTNEDILDFMKDIYNRGVSDSDGGVPDFDFAFEGESI